MLVPEPTFVSGKLIKNVDFLQNKFKKVLKVFVDVLV